MELILAISFDEKSPELVQQIVELAQKHGREVAVIGLRDKQSDSDEEYKGIIIVEPDYNLKNTMMMVSDVAQSPGIGNAMVRLAAEQFPHSQILIAGPNPYSRGFADSNIFIERIEAHCELATLSDLNLKSNRKISAVKKIPFPAQCKAAKRNYFPGMRRK